MIMDALYHRYSSSQNYYYTKKINELITNSRISAVIQYKDQLIFDGIEEDMFKRYYAMEDLPEKFQRLTEYYKYYRDIPRLFTYPVVRILNKYHDKKRNLEYDAITKLIKEEERVEKGLPKEASPLPSPFRPMKEAEKVLKSLYFEDDRDKIIQGLYDLR